MTSYDCKGAKITAELRRLSLDRAMMSEFLANEDFYRKKAVASTPAEARKMYDNLSYYWPIIHRWNSRPRIYHAYGMHIRRISDLRKILLAANGGHIKTGKDMSCSPQQTAAEQRGESCYLGLDQRVKGQERTADAPKANRAQKCEKPSYRDISSSPSQDPKRDVSMIKDIRQKREQASIYAPEPSMTFDEAFLLRYFKHKGLVGEQATALLSTYGLIHKLCFGVEGHSSSGKSFTLNNIVDLIGDEHIGRVELGSKRSAWYRDDLDEKQVLYFTELQKAADNKDIMEILKNLGEGTDAVREITVPGRKGKRETVKAVIQAGKGVAYTLATENLFKKDIELSTRYWQVYTDISDEQTRRIEEARALRANLGEDLSLMEQEEISMLRQHLISCLHTPGMRYVNPYRMGFFGQGKQPVKARRFQDHLIRMVEGCAKFHYGERLRDDDKLLVELSDMYTIHRCYSKQFVMSINNIPFLGDVVLDRFEAQEDAGEGKGKPGLSPEEMFNAMLEDYSSLTQDYISHVFTQLANSGFLMEEGRRKYTLGKRQDYSFATSMDWQQVWLRGMAFMQEWYPDSLEEWKEKQLTDGSLVVWDPLTEHDVVLFSPGHDKS
ncbi:hypothetical protein GF351_00570 [Candidatus Woesearchaeota archaeon]|nr:hypothetical protein [Candidatus Woesearchaeota archaeon]